MSKLKLASIVASKTGAPKRAVARILDEFLEGFVGLLRKGKKVTLGGFGTFRVLRRKPRRGRNPRTGEPLTIPSALVVRFRAGAGLRRAVR